MSFLNPVNEPVLRFSSTDADAPQINYAARTAGDVKTVLKACLVTGYGDKASAGWSIINEVDHVAEFVSPSAAMSDYRLGINDTSGASTGWYYYQQDLRIDPVGNNPIKNFQYVDKSSDNNGWQLLTTKYGIFLIEIVQSSVVAAPVARLTYWGKVKSALPTETSNICFWNVGFLGASDYTHSFFSYKALITKAHYKLNSLTGFVFAATNIGAINADHYDSDSTISLASELYIASVDANLLSNFKIVAKQPAILLKSESKTESIFDGVYDTTSAGRPVIKICLGQAHANIEFVRWASVNVLIHLDYWDY